MPQAQPSTESAEGLEVAKRNGVKCIAVTNAPRGAAEACGAPLTHALLCAGIKEHPVVIGIPVAQGGPTPAAEEMAR